MDTISAGVPNKRIVSRSLPNVLALAESSQARRSSSFTASMQPSSGKLLLCNSRPPNNILSVEKTEASSPTIGELLGDNQSFHDRYHHRYSIPKFSRKRHHHPSHSRLSRTYVHPRRTKRLRASYLDRSRESTHPYTSTSSNMESTTSIGPLYPYSIAYNYPSFCTYGCCYYSSAASCYPGLVSDCYARLYYPEISYGSPACDPSSSYSDYYFSGRNRSQSHAYQ